MSGSQSDGDTDRTPVDDADVCVVGAGPAGALLSHSLAKRGHDVVILEAGPRFDMEKRVERMKRQIHPERGVNEIWDMGGERDAYTDSSDREMPLNKRRVKGVGGTSLHWGSVVPRFRERDFEMQSRHGVAKDWPISYEDLRPYYAQAEQEIGVAGPDDAPHQPPREEGYPMDPLPESSADELYKEAGEALDIDVQPMPMAINTGAYDRNQCQGYGTCEHVCPSGGKYTADIHVRKAEEEGATVLTEVPVQRLEHGPDGEEITAAVYETPDGETYRQTADTFVAAAGAYETPRLLFLSDSDQYPDGLANSSGTVGKYVMDHGGGLVVGFLPDHETSPGAYGPVISSGIFQFYDDDEEPTGGINMMLLNSAEPPLPEVAMRSDKLGDDLLADLEIQYGGTIGTSISAEMLPREDNRITLDESKTDDRGNPVPEVNMTAGQYVRDATEKAVQAMTDMVEELGGNVVLSQGSHTPDAEYIEDAKAGYHPMGGTRMGTDPEESVVDPTLKTHDLDNLYISGGGVFVTGGASNPTLTIMALSLKAADHIHEELQ
ncbi:GMC family oxidoreductase [Halomicroarcula sp. F28]|uniref:GMC family oxidoreductase n=1 Tax=Haloarcula salinisoli TaxID=2487746 RepID=UPI001C739203|nr:GMC family oxidoreductase [Halomicroarcula salinisoli]MBX0286253.1 GMC family oxidoreductase [Halomicroarcula salinisoli]